MIKYEGTVYRPPSEYDSLIIQATLGCPHNQCNFCNMYRDRKFQIRKLDEIKKDLHYAKGKYGDSIEKIFFADGNTILMKTKDLLDLLNYSNELFPNLKRITMYGSAQYINLKTLDEFKQLKEAGLTRIHSGMESGDDEVLILINKGFYSQEMIKAGQLVKEANIELSLYYIVGIGGKKYSQIHALNSAKVVNQINPDYIRLRTFIPFKGTTLYEMYKNNEFQLLNAHEALNETKILVKSLKNIDSYLISDHISNYCKVKGKFPCEKESILEELNHALSLDLSNFRNPEKGTL